MGLFKKKIVKKTYDREHMKPVIRASICTGEEVAGFKDIRTGKIEEIMLIRSPEDLEKFKEIYEINIAHHQYANAGDVSGAHGFYTTTNTMYYVTFQMESGDRMEFQVSGIEYGMLAEGDTGELTFQGTRYLAFER